MARYDRIYAALAKRAVREGVVGAESFIERLSAAGMPEEAIEERLIEDLNTGGKIFGRFTRSLEAAAGGSVLAAEVQGEAVARAYAEELLSLAEMDDILEDADAETLESVENRLDRRAVLIWVAMLRNTCDRCLPLHGKSDTREGWAERGLDPKTMHDESWKSECECNLVPVDELDDLMGLVAPLVRERVRTETGLPGSKRTQRLVAQRDIDKAMAAVERARQTPEGRRTLRLMGEVQAGGEITVKEGPEHGRAKAVGE